MKIRSAAFPVLLGLWGGAASFAAAPVRVPQDARTLEAAISRVADGGVIEIAAGTYSPAGGSFVISNLRKGFTIRAAAGAEVVLDGGGGKSILRYVNSSRSRGKRVVFERLVFRNGFSDSGGVGGAGTLVQAEALFRGCVFEGNRTTGLVADGGALHVSAGSSVAFVDSVLRGNSSLVNGGALVIVGATVTIQGGELTDNRTNLPGHYLFAAGGAIYLLDGVLQVAGTRFERNLTGWVGGAIYAIGHWDGAGAQVQVLRSSFLSNQTLSDPCCANPEPTAGGAIHVEDNTVLRVHQSLLRDNQADFGGGIDAFRAAVEVYASVFQRNRGTEVRPGHGVGGAIAVLSNDGTDASTGFGAINRPSARLTVERSLFQGGGGDATLPGAGGCVFAQGDGNRLRGENGVAQNGTAAENRARVEIAHSVFAGCDAASAGAILGVGGGLLADVADLALTDSLFLDSDALGDGAHGGALEIDSESSATVARCTFAHNSAEDSGGALFVRGSTLDLADSRFYANFLAPGPGGGQGRGAALFAIPRLSVQTPAGVGGRVHGNAFFANIGVPIWDVDPASGPTNEMRYDGNRFDSGAGGRVYVDSLVAAGGLGVGELNALTVVRGGGRPPTDKSDGTNQSVLAPREGAVVDVPAAAAVGPAPASPTASALAYAAVGGSLALGDFPLPPPAGLLDLAPGDYPLKVGGTAVATAHLLGTCTAGPYLCLNGNRFRAEVGFKIGSQPGTARAVSVTGDTGTFWFLDPANVELAVKVLDGRHANGAFWVFYGALSNLEYDLAITDLETNLSKVYHNPVGTLASLGDTAAFPAALAKAESPPSAVGQEPLLAGSEACAPGPQSLCLNGGRFRVELSWRASPTLSGAGQAVALTGDTGYFWFTSPNNLEVVVKVLDGRPVNGFFWVFYGALTNLEYTLKVTDTATGAVRTYTNPLGRFGSRADTQALPGP
jgi:predicted outer membrane repeat protein